MDKPESRLGVRKTAASATRKFFAHPAIHLASYPWHGIGLLHSVADDERSAGFFRADQKRRQIERRMLAIAIERHGPIETELETMGQSPSKRCALALVVLVANHNGACVLGYRGGFISGTIVHHNHQGKLLPHR